MSNRETLDKLQADTTVPSGFTHVTVSENLLLCLIDIVNDMPLIKASVTVATDLRVTV